MTYPSKKTQRALTQALGHAHRLTATPGSTLKIRRMPLITAKVNVNRDGDSTTRQAAPAKSGSSRASTR